MYKFRAIPTLEGKAAEYFYEIQEMMATTKPNFDIKSSREAYNQIMERSRQRKATRNGVLK